MKPRRSSKTRHKFKFTLKVDHVVFPSAIARKLSSSKFYVLLNRGDNNNETKIGSITKDGTLQFNGQEISINATLFKNRSSNSYISKHCRIVLRQIKSSSHQNTKARESSVGSIKFDLVDYIDRIPITERLLFAKCALSDVLIECCIVAQELFVESDDNNSVTSANTIRVDSFWLDVDDNDNIGEGDEGQESIHLTDKHLIQFDGKQKEMAKFRIKHAMDIMANDASYFDDLKEEIKEKDANIKHFHEEEAKWNAAMIEWEREKTSFEASTIELNFKYQQQIQQNKECKQELSSVTLYTKRMITEKERMEEKYNKLVQSLSKDRKPLLIQIGHLQMEYDDLEESLIQQQNSFRQTGHIMEMELEKQKRKTLCAVNELKKYKLRYDRLKPQNIELQKKIEKLEKEKYQHEIDIAQIKYDAQQMVNQLIMDTEGNKSISSYCSSNNEPKKRRKRKRGNSVKNLIDAIEKDEDVDMENGKASHRHVRSSNSVNIETLETLNGININDLIVNGNSERNLSESGNGDENTEYIKHTKPQDIVDID